MTQKSVAPAEKTVEQLVAIVKKDLLWLLVSMGVAVVAGLAVNMFYTL